MTILFPREMNNPFDEKEQGVIYLLTAPNGKSYVGQTWMYLSDGSKKGMKGRWKQHVNLSNIGGNQLICRAIRKYGFKNFTQKVLVRTHKDFLDPFEEMCIKMKNTLAPNGYNVQTGGKKMRHTEESKKAMSKTMKEKLKCPDMRKKWSKAKIGKRQNGTRKKKRKENAGLPKYVMYYQYKHYTGYEVQYTPPEIDVKVTKKFTKSKLSIEEKLKLAIEFVKSLHKQYGTTFE